MIEVLVLLLFKGDFREIRVVRVILLIRRFRNQRSLLLLRDL
jgi:hypothetical protein